MRTRIVWWLAWAVSWAWIVAALLVAATAAAAPPADRGQVWNLVGLLLEMAGPWLVVAAMGVAVGAWTQPPGRRRTLVLSLVAGVALTVVLWAFAGWLGEPPQALEG